MVDIIYTAGRLTYPVPSSSNAYLQVLIMCIKVSEGLKSNPEEVFADQRHEWIQDKWWSRPEKENGVSGPT